MTNNTISYGSVCSGIEAASVAWEALGFSTAWFSQFDPEHKYKNGPDFPSAVLAHHWPEVPNLGDMTKLAAKMRAGEMDAPDILVGGTPCQAFSVAGARAGLSDPRGQLTISYGELADAIDDRRAAAGLPPAIIVWENVPGVLSSKDNAFGAFLGLLAGEDCELQPPGKRWANSGCVLRGKRNICWRVFDAKYFGVPQQRRRMFVVASARNDVDIRAILFDTESGSRPVAKDTERFERCTTGADGSALYRFKRTDSYIIDGLSSTLSARDYKDRRDLVVTASGRVRELTPVEYERLQGFPDNHTLVPYLGRQSIDPLRYKAIGNSMAVPVMRWIGNRILSAIHATSVAIPATE